MMRHAVQKIANGDNNAVSPQEVGCVVVIWFVFATPDQILCPESGK